MLVAVEVRYPNTAPKVERAHATLRDRLSCSLPLQDDGMEHELRLAEGFVQQRSLALRRFISPDRTTAATFADDRLIVETSDYQGFDSFAPLLHELFRTLCEEVGPAAVERVGLRYIDEVRVDQGDHTAAAQNWEGWIAPQLLAAETFDAGLPGLSRRHWRGRIDFDWAESSRVVLRYGPRTGHATSPTGVPRRPGAPSAGPYFLLDIDSYWHPTDRVPAFEAPLVSDTCARLHEPISAMFEAAITDRLRNEVLRKEPV